MKYITKDSLLVKQATPVKRLLMTILSIFFILFSVLGLNVQAFYAQQEEDDESSALPDPVTWLVCRYEEDNFLRQLVQLSSTDDKHLYLNSRSIGSTGGNTVNNYLFNDLISIGVEKDFEERNKEILGRNLSNGYFDPNNSEELTEEEREKLFNRGTPMNPYDRFGMAGLKFTNYHGEWKYLFVDICSNGVINDPSFSSYYDGRLEPKTTYENRSESFDNRVLQHVNGAGNRVDSAIFSILGNWVFSVTKGVVGVTLALINLAFSDINSVLGINDIIAGSDGSGGIYQSLHENLFQPLIVLMFVVAAAYIFYYGIVKFRAREAFSVLLKSVAMFFIAVIISINPATFTSLPNNITVLGQSFIVSAMAESIAGGGGLCSITEPVEEYTPENSSTFNNRVDESYDLMTQATEEIKSSIGCTIWHQFLFKPWVDAQFGTDWNNLWANGHIPEWADGGRSLGNNSDSEEIVGDAAVPMGGGTFLHNWALFHISTMTNAHNFIDKDGLVGAYTSEVANDWWRIVDALSNYDEQTITSEVSDDSAASIEAAVKINPTPYWDTWVGNSAITRLTTSLTSVPVAVIGLAMPLFFAGLSAIYAIGLTILMAFSPIFFLLGVWPSKGYEIFKGWGELVIKTLIKRIIVALLLMLSLILTGVAIKIMEDVSWWQGIILMIVSAYGLYRAKDYIIEMFANIGHSSFNMSQPIDRMTNFTKRSINRSAKTAALTAAGSARGAVIARKSGVSAFKGARAGARGALKNEVVNIGYRNRAVRDLIISKKSYSMSEESVFEGSNERDKYCAGCDMHLESLGVGTAFIDDIGLIYCENCVLHNQSIMDDVNKDELREINIYDEMMKLSKNNKQRITSRPFDKIYNQNKQSIEKETHASNEREKAVKQEAIAEVAAGVEEQIKQHERQYENTQTTTPPEIPKQLEPYIDKTAVDLAWNAGDYDAIREMYSASWGVMMYHNLNMEVEGVLEEEMLRDIKKYQEEAREKMEKKRESLSK